MAVVVLALRIVQAIAALVILSLSAYVANWYNMDTLTASPTEINFLIVAPLLTFLSLAYLELVPRFAPRASHPYANLGVNFLNVVLYLAGFSALADFLRQLLFCRGSVCAAARAAAVFSAGQFLLFGFTFGMLAWETFRGGRGRPQRGIAMQEKGTVMA